MRSFSTGLQFVTVTHGSVSPSRTIYVYFILLLRVISDTAGRHETPMQPTPNELILLEHCNTSGQACQPNGGGLVLLRDGIRHSEPREHVPSVHEVRMWLGPDDTHEPERLPVLVAQRTRERPDRFRSHHGHGDGFETRRVRRRITGKPGFRGLGARIVGYVEEGPPGARIRLQPPRIHQVGNHRLKSGQAVSSVTTRKMTRT